LSKKPASVKVHQLAKELDVSSKDIVAWCQKEEIPDIANHLSNVSMGLANTLRAHFKEATPAAAIDSPSAEAQTSTARTPQRAGLQDETSKPSVFVVLDCDSLWEFAERNSDASARGGALEGGALRFDLRALRSALISIPSSHDAPGKLASSSMFIPVFRESARSSQIALQAESDWSSPIFAPELWVGPECRRIEAIHSGSAAAIAAIVSRLLDGSRATRVLLVSQRFAECELRPRRGRSGLMPWQRERLSLMHFGIEGITAGVPLSELDWSNASHWPPIVDATGLRHEVFVVPSAASKAERLHDSLGALQAIMKGLVNGIATACRSDQRLQPGFQSALINSCRVVVACELVGFACHEALSASTKSTHAANDLPLTPSVKDCIRAVLMTLLLSTRTEPHVREVEPALHACFELLRELTNKQMLGIHLGEPMQHGYKSNAGAVKLAFHAALPKAQSLSTMIGRGVCFPPSTRASPLSINDHELESEVMQLIGSFVDCDNPSIGWSTPIFDLRRSLDRALNACWKLSQLDVVPSGLTVEAVSQAEYPGLLNRAAIANRMLIERLRKQRSQSLDFSLPSFDRRWVQDESCIRHLPPKRLNWLAIRYKALDVALSALCQLLSGEAQFPFNFSTPEARSRVQSGLELVAEAQCGLRTEFDELSQIYPGMGDCPTQQATFDWLRKMVARDAMGVVLPHMTRRSNVSLGRSEQIIEEASRVADR
jgi:hypothetical protein